MTNDKAGTFRRGTNAGTAKCAECGRTRQRANMANELTCVDCYERAGDDNAVADGQMTVAAYHERYGEHSWACPTLCPIPGGVK